MFFSECTDKGQDIKDLSYKEKKKKKQNVIPYVQTESSLRELYRPGSEAKRSSGVSTHGDFEKSAGQGPEQALLTERLVVV